MQKQPCLDSYLNKSTVKITQETIRGMKILPGLFITENDYLCGRCDLMALKEPGLDVVAQAFNSSTREARIGESLVSLRPASSIN